MAANKNAKGAYVRQLLEKLDCCPFTGMVRIALAQVPCLECDGKGKQGYREHIETGALMVDPRRKKEICQKCYGTGREPVPYETRGKQFAQLANYVAPKLASVEADTQETTRVIIKDYSNGAAERIEREQKTIEHSSSAVEWQRDDDNSIMVNVTREDDD